MGKCAIRFFSTRCFISPGSLSFGLLCPVWKPIMGTVKKSTETNDSM